MRPCSVATSCWLVTVVLLTACGETVAGTGVEDESPSNRMHRGVSFAQSNGDSIQYLGDITTTAHVVAMANGPFWHTDRWWHDTGGPLPEPWTPPEGGWGTDWTARRLHPVGVAASGGHPVQVVAGPPCDRPIRRATRPSRQQGDAGFPGSRLGRVARD